MTVTLLSDTHISDGEQEIPGEFREMIREADHVIHAGDFGSKQTLVNVQDLASHLTAVYGNADPDDIDLPSVASVEVNNVTFVVTHGTVNLVERAVLSSEGVIFDRDDWLEAIADTAQARADDPVVGIGGHSHGVEDTVHDGIRLLNPGSATGTEVDKKTMMTIKVTDDEPNVTTHEI